MSALVGVEHFGRDRFRHGIFRGQQFKDAFAGGAGLGDLVVQPGEIFHRAIHVKNTAGEQDEIARVGVRPRQINHVKQRQRHAKGGKKINDRAGDFAGADDSHVVADGFARGPAKLVGHHIFQIVGLDDPVAGEGFAS